MWFVNKYTIAGALIVLLIGMYSAWLHRHDSELVSGFIELINLETKEDIQDDHNAVDEQSTILDDFDIINWLLDENCDNNRQECSSEDSNGQSNADTNERNGIESDSRSWFEMELPTPYLFEHTEEGSNSPNILYCTPEMMRDCDVFPECCEAL